MTEPTAPASPASPEISHERIVDLPTTPTQIPRSERSKLADVTPRDEAGLTEYQRHNIERGRLKDPRPESEKAAKPAAKVDKSAAKADNDADEELDLDRRTKATRRILELKGITKSQEARIAELQSQLTTRGTPDHHPRSTVDPKAGEASEAPAAKTDVEPNLDDFPSYADWQKAHTRWTVREERRTEREAERASATQEREQSEKQDRFRKFGEGFEAARAKHPDFDEAISRIPTEAVHPSFKFLNDAILNSEVSTEFAYYVGSQPDVMKFLMSAPDLTEHLRRIGRVEAAVEALGATAAPSSDQGRRAPTTRAPLPTTPVSTNGHSARTSDPDYSKMDAQTYRESRHMGRSINGR